MTVAMTATNPHGLVGVPVQIVLGQPSKRHAGAPTSYAPEQDDFARRLSDPGSSLEWRSEKLREYRRHPKGLRRCAELPRRAQGPERIIQVAPEVLRSYLAAPARMAWLGQWFSRNGVALDCTAIAAELSGLVFRRHRRDFRPEWAEGWTAWMRWMTRDTVDARGEPAAAPPSGDSP